MALASLREQLYSCYHCYFQCTVYPSNFRASIRCFVVHCSITMSDDADREANDDVEPQAAQSPAPLGLPWTIRRAMQAEVSIALTRLVSQQ